jgi:hypothetical protein
MPKTSTPRCAEINLLSRASTISISVHIPPSSPILDQLSSSHCAFSLSFDFPKRWPCFSATQGSPASHEVPMKSQSTGTRTCTCTCTVLPNGGRRVPSVHSTSRPLRRGRQTGSKVTCTRDGCSSILLVHRGIPESLQRREHIHMRGSYPRLRLYSLVGKPVLSLALDAAKLGQGGSESAQQF